MVPKCDSMWTDGRNYSSRHCIPQGTEAGSIQRVTGNSVAFQPSMQELQGMGNYSLDSAVCISQQNSASEAVNWVREIE